MKNKNPFFSIVTVTKNCHSRVLLTLQSVKNQSYKNYEHIIIDSYSEDGTFEIIKNFKNSKSKKFQINDNSIYDAFNKAYKITSGNFVLVLSAGDIFFNDITLERVKEKISIYDDLFAGNCIFFDNSLNVKRIWKKPKNLNFFNSFYFCHSGLFINKRIINAIGYYNTSYSISSDTDYILRILKKKRIINNSPQNIIFMELGGVSTRKKNLLKKICQDLLIYFKYFNIFFFFFYFLKVLSKLNQFNINNPEIHKKKLIYQIKNLTNKNL